MNMEIFTEYLTMKNMIILAVITISLISIISYYYFKRSAPNVQVPIPTPAKIEGIKIEENDNIILPDKEYQIRELNTSLTGNYIIELVNLALSKNNNTMQQEDTLVLNDEEIKNLNDIYSS